MLLAAGCGFAGNPAYFPHWLPAGDIIRTHGKPSGPSYYADFDPYARKIAVFPLEATSPVNRHYVIVASVLDEHGRARRGRRVEWMLEGAGHIIEVDESGFAPGRGYKVDNRYAVSYTDYFEHTITRGNADPSDDFVIRPGQSWCVISSPVEGDSLVTVYCPEIFNWEQNKVTVTVHWLSAAWALPPAAVARAGAGHVLRTTIIRTTDRMPLANYRVRYTVLDGPPAVFEPGRQPVVEVVSDTQGQAAATLLETTPQPGVNRIGIEIIRPPDAYNPTGPGLVIGRGETQVEWQAPRVALSVTGPQTAAPGQSFSYTITVSNSSPLEVEALTVRGGIAEGLVFESAAPPANQEGTELIWTLGPVAPGRSVVLRATFRAPQPGSYTFRVQAITPEGQRTEATAVTRVGSAQLGLSLATPAQSYVGSPVVCQVTVVNQGAAVASGVHVELRTRAQADVAAPVQLGDLAPGEARTLELRLTPRQAGELLCTLEARSRDGHAAHTESRIQVIEVPLAIRLEATPVHYVDKPTRWTIQVENKSNTPVHEVWVQQVLPPGILVENVNENGHLQNGQVLWHLGTLAPAGHKELVVHARPQQPVGKAQHIVLAGCTPGGQCRAELPVEIRGAVAFSFDIQEDTDPVAVGGYVHYVLRVGNTGSLPLSDIQVRASLTDHLRLLSAQGPVTSRIEKNAVVFAPLAQLPPGSQLVCRVTAQAAEPGDARMRAEMISPALGNEPLIREEPTTVVPPHP